MKKPDPNFTLKLSEFVESHVRQDHCHPISKSLAEIIEIIAKDTLICHVQWESNDGSKLETPLLWKYQYWAIDCERWLTRKRIAQEEKITRDILEANLKRVALALQYATALQYSQCLIVARKHLIKNNRPILDWLSKEHGLKLITKREEL